MTADENYVKKGSDSEIEGTEIHRKMAGTGSKASSENASTRATNETNVRNSNVIGEVAVGASTAVGGFFTTKWVCVTGLKLLGFGSLGPTASSIAAWTQAPFTASGSWFSIFQAIGMTGSLGPFTLPFAIFTSVFGITVVVPIYRQYMEGGIQGSENDKKIEENEDARDRKSGDSDRQEKCRPAEMAARLVPFGLPVASLAGPILKFSTYLGTGSQGNEAKPKL